MMKQTPWITNSPMRRERLVNLAEFRRPVLAAEGSALEAPEQKLTKIEDEKAP
jgi:hypothetical protein